MRQLQPVSLPLLYLAVNKVVFYCDEGTTTEHIGLCLFQNVLTFRLGLYCFAFAVDNLIGKNGVIEAIASLEDTLLLFQQLFYEV